MNKINRQCLPNSKVESQINQSFFKQKQLIDKMTKWYAKENYSILNYLKKVTLAEWTDAYIKSSTNNYEPGEQKEANTLISSMLQKAKKDQNLEEEK